MKDYTYKKTTLSRHEFMRQVLVRLQNEVGYYLMLLEKHPMEHYGQQVGVGYFSVVRMLAPVIETLGTVDNLSPQEFLRKKLHILKPYMTWTIFRDGLMHNDHGPIVIIYGEKRVYWKLQMDLDNAPNTHSTRPGYILLDLLRLYEDLKQYVAKEAENTEAGNVKIITAIELKSGSNNIEVNAMLEELGNDNIRYGFRKVDN